MNTIAGKIITEIYDPSPGWKYDLWPLKLIALLFIIANFHLFNKTPILKSGLIIVFEGLFLIYTLMFFVFFKNKPTFKVQILGLVLDFLFIAFFDYLSLSLFGYSSRIYALYLIPVIYCGYWFNWFFTLVFVTMASAVYALFNYYIPEMRLLYTTGEKIGKLAPIAGIFYLSALAVILYKKKVQRDFSDADQKLKERAEKLEQEKKLTQTLLKDKIDGFIAVDEEGNIAETNQMAQELMGYSEKEILGINAREIYAPWEPSRIMKALRQSPDGTIYDLKTWIRSKEKEETPILLSAALVYDRELNLEEMLAKGKKFPSIMYFRDIRVEEIFNNIARDITAITNEKELLDMIVKIVADTIKAETCCILIYNEHSGLIETISSYGIPEDFKGRRGIESYTEDEGETGHVFSTGKTINITNLDVANEEPKDSKVIWKYARRFAEYSRFGDFRHVLATPLRIQGEVYGVIRVLNKYVNDKELAHHGFIEKDILLLRRIAHQVSILLEKVGNKERFGAISKVGIELNAKVDIKLDDLLHIIVRGVVGGMKFKACSLRLIEDGDKLRIKTSYGFKENFQDEKFTIKIGEGISGRVAETGIIRNNDGLENEKDFTLKELLLNEGIKSMLSIPLRHHNRVIGVMNCYSGRKHKFTEQENQVLQTFAVYAGVAIQNKKRMDELMALNEIGSELLKPFQPDTSEPFGSEKLLDIILQQAKAISGADRLCLKKHDEFSGEISTIRALNCDWYERNKDFKFKPGLDNLSGVVKSGEPIIIKNFDMEKHTVENVPDKDLLKNIKSRIILPFKTYGKVLVELCLESYRENFFTENDTLILRAFSIQASIALRNAHFLNKLRMVTETFPKISELDIDIDKVLKTIVEIAAKVLETDILILYLYDAKHKKIKWPPILSGDIYYPEFTESEEISSDKLLAFINIGKSYYASKAQEDPIMIPKDSPARKGIPGTFVSREKIISSAVIMLKVGQDIIGVMFIDYRTLHEFNTDEQQIIEIFASYIAVVIQNVVYFSEKKTADTMNTLGKFSTNFAHKIKNDISTINLYTGDLMDETKPGSPQYFPLTQIKEKISKITTDINFLSNLSKAYILEKKSIDVSDLIRELKSEILPDLERKKIKLEIEIQPGLPKIEIDPSQIKMVFINLAQNSIDAMPEGGKIFLGILRSNSNLVFEWTDTGCGIPPEYAHKIFDILWSTKEKGSGLGLFYVKTIVEEHGGTISLDLTHKGGARFVIIIPLSEPFDPEAK